MLVKEYSLLFLNWDHAENPWEIAFQLISNLYTNTTDWKFKIIRAYCACIYSRSKRTINFNAWTKASIDTMFTMYFTLKFFIHSLLYLHNIIFQSTPFVLALIPIPLHFMLVYKRRISYVLLLFPAVAIIRFEFVEILCDIPRITRRHKHKQRENNANPFIKFSRLRELCSSKQ